MLEKALRDARDAANLQIWGGGEGLEGVADGDLGKKGARDEDQARLGGQGLGKGDGIEGVDVRRGVGGKRLEFDLLDGSVGVEDDGGDGVISAGAVVEEGASGAGYERGRVAEDLLEEGRFFAVVGGDKAVGEFRGVELGAGVGGEQGGEDPDGCEGGGELEADRRGPGRRMSVKVGMEVVGEPECDEGGERSVGRGHVVGQAGLNAAEEKDLKDGEDCERPKHAERRSAERGRDRCGIEEDPGRRGEEQDAEVVPPWGEVSVELVSHPAQDVEAEVLLDEDLPVEVIHVEVPGENEGQEDQEAEEESLSCESAAEVGVDREEDEQAEEEGSAGGGLAHEGDGKAGPIEVPAVGGGRFAEEVGEADDGKEGAEGEERVGFPDAGDVEEAEGREEDEGGEPGGQVSCELVAGAE